MIRSAALLFSLAPILFAQSPAPRANSALNCAVGSAPRTVRYEGMSELASDILMSCTGGTATDSGKGLTAVDVTVSLNTTVTSRIWNTSATPIPSEALLLIDEPGNGQTGPAPGFGSSAPQTLCSSISGAVTGGCLEWARDFAVTGGTIQVAGNAGTGNFTAGANVFQGVVNGNQVVFHGVPILEPAVGSARVFRITNIRANVSQLQTTNSAPTTLTATVSATGPVSVNLTNPAQTVAYVQTALNTSVLDAANSAALTGGGVSFSQCTGSSTPVPVAMLSFSETLNNGAFLPRVVPTANYNGQSATPSQNTPGSTYNSESGFVFPPAANGSLVAGLADSGTRLMATFNNIPNGVRIFVSVTNLAANTSSATSTAPAGNSTSAYAALIKSESIADGNGTLSLVSPTTSVNGSATSLAELTVVHGTATAIWEVINTNPGASEKFLFGVWQQFTSGTNSPPPGTATVDLSFAPSYTPDLGTVASSSWPIPRFVDLSTPANFLSITACVSCTFTLSGNTSYSTAASTGTVTVAASDPSCTWTAASSASWASISSGSSSGTGSGTVQFSVAANSSSSSRTATLTIAGQSYIVTQAGTKANTTTTLTASPASVALGQAIVLTAGVAPSTATGSVTFYDGTTTLGPGTLSGGTASLSISTLAAGSHSLNAVYSGDTNFNGSTSASATVGVGAGTATSVGIAALPNPATAGQTVTLSAVVLPSAATGTITFKDGSTTLNTLTISNGAAGFTTSSLTVGTHSLTASYSGDSKYTGNTSQPAAEVINPATNQTSTSLSATPNPATAGQPVTLTVTVTPSTAGGTVTFLDGQSTLKIMALSYGAATFSTAALSTGTHILTAYYNGDPNNAPSTASPVNEVINSAATASVSLNVTPNPASTSQPVTLTATMTPASATGSITFKDSGAAINISTLANGVAVWLAPGFSSGSHSFTAAYSGDGTYPAATSSAVVETVNSTTATTTSVSASPNPASAGQAVTLTAAVSPNSASGSVTFKDGTSTLGTVSLTGGTASMAVSTLPTGTRSLTATYNGNTTYGPSTSTAFAEVITPAVTTVTLSSTPNPASFGQAVTLGVTVSPATSAGTVSVFDSTTSTSLGTATLSSGAASIPTSILKAGTHSLQATYTDNSGTSTNSAVITEAVNPAPTTLLLSATPATSTPGQSVSLTATIAPSSATGAVLFKDGTTTVAIGNLSNGTATATVSTLSAGTHTLLASYGGDGNYAPTTSNAINQVVGAPTACAAFPAGFVPFTSIANLSQLDAAGDFAVAGNMTLPNYASYQSLPLPAATNQQFCGSVFLAPGIPVVAYVPTAAERSGNFSAFTGLLLDPASGIPFPGGVIPASRIPDAMAWRIAAVLQNSMTTLTVAPLQSNLGQAVTLTATVTPSSATGTVTFLDGSTNIGTMTLTGGTATLTTSTLATGSHLISASYGGDSKTALSTSSVVSASVTGPTSSTTTTLAATPSSATLGQPVTLTATISPSSATGTVTFKDGSAALGSTTLTSGIATYTTSTLSAGSHTLTAVYGGDAKNAISTSSPVTVSVVLSTTTMALTVTPVTAAPGQAVTMTATVTPATATGAVTFKDGTAALGTGTLTNGVATYTTAVLTAGSHTLTAIYAGDSANTSSTSNPVIETIGLAPTTTALTVNPTSAALGQNIALTATVTPSTATGVITFQDGLTALGTSNLNNGVAVFTTTSLLSGIHSLTAVYGGDSKNGPSTSNPVSETVASPATTTTLSVSPSPSTIGQTITLTATVNPPTATGTVTFRDFSTTLGTATLSSGGTASYTTSSLTAGSHTLSAVYSGDSSNGGSTSNAVTQSVTKTTTTLALSISPASTAPVGQSVTLTATVTPSSTTGSVTFLDSQAVLGTGNVAAGTAVFSTSSLAAGSHAISASYGGDSRDGASISSTIAYTVTSGSPLQITSPAAPTMGFVGSAWSQTYKVVGGTPPYKWTMPANNMTDLALTASGDTAVVAGTPQTAGSYQLNVRVQDSASQSTSTGVTVGVYPPLSITLSAAQPVTPADQPMPQLSLGQSYPFAMTGTLALTFVPNATGTPAGYNAAQFSDGTTRFAVIIPANSTTPNPPVPAVQLGSVAGDVVATLGPLMVTGTAQLVPSDGPSPSVKITNVTASGFQVFLDASSTTRDLTSGAFVFTAAPGRQMTGCSPNCTVNFASEAAAWFASADGIASGGNTSLSVPFTFSGDTSVIATVSVTLTNSAGTSAAVSGGR